MLDYEAEARKNGFSLIIGVDEAGRGPLAGPVVASAVALRTSRFSCRIDDSKKISSKKRLEAFYEIYENAYIGVGIISEVVIDEINILQATFVAMSNAVEQLIARIPSSEKTGKNFEKNVCLLIDGPHFESDLPYAHQTIVDGDALVQSISCASIVAKVTRDRILENYDRIFPEYGYKRHKGYPTPEHKQAIRRFGPSMIQRKTFTY